jgi:hypothetical protein
VRIWTDDEVEKDPAVKAAFDDIRRVRKSDFVNNFWHAFHSVAGSLADAEAAATAATASVPGSIAKRRTTGPMPEASGAPGQGGGLANANASKPLRWKSRFASSGRS